MTRVLLTGGNGFVAAHIIDALLSHGHSVVATVRSLDKAQAVLETHSAYGKGALDTVLVEDITKHDAFDQAVVSDPPFDAVIHSASPFHFRVKDNKRDMLDPAIEGTKNILASITKFAPTVKRVVVTSAFCAIVDTFRQGHYTYSEKDWNPVTFEYASQVKTGGYRGSKALAERAAWDFMRDHEPAFTLATIQAPLMIGPIRHRIESLAQINESSVRFRDLVQGVYGDRKLVATDVPLWVDVRDAALAHVRCVELPEAGGLRFFVTAGTCSNRTLAEIIYQHYPQLRDRLPAGHLLDDSDFPGGVDAIGFDNSRSKDVLGLAYRPLETSVVDTVNTILALA